ncbi:MAG: DUF6891 domain-containing protein [Methanobrevibacter sp.]|uniref:DUF6891 domain-containing protein n=1 Tax=Methanobrevibacter sp. TaxID=66852 RepID=UPI003F010642
MNSDTMNQDLVDELEYMIDLLTKSGFFNSEEIFEILEDQFIDEELDFSEFNISINNCDNTNFSILESVFENLSKKSIVCVHNCGYDIKEGVLDIFELYAHLINNGLTPEGFCFYTFEDVENAIYEGNLKITFGDFNKDEDKALSIGKIIYNQLKDVNFDVNWDISINTQIKIVNFDWDKSYNENMEYELEGAYELFKGVNE